MRKATKRKTGLRVFSLVRVVGEFRFDPTDFESRNSDPAHRFARKRLISPTIAEKKFEEMLNQFEGGFLAGKFEREWAICGKWILDFYFPKLRLAIEIDGEYHESSTQIDKDKRKAEDCEKLGIELIRLQNQAVFNKPIALIERIQQRFQEIYNTADSKSAPTEIEQTLILRHFEFYKSLANGKRNPLTAEQLHFVQMCQGLVAPKSEHEIAFAKFIKLKLKELKNEHE